VVPPLILIDQPPLGGIQATAVATITAAGALASVTLVNPGAGYTVLPNVYVIPQFLDYPGQLALPYTVPVSPTPIAPNFPPGQIAIGPGGTSFAGVIPQNFAQGLQASSPSTAGALVTFGAGVLAGSGTLTGLVVFDYGSGYSTVPAITFAGGTLAGGVAATSLMSWALVSATQTAGAAFTVGNPIKSTLGYFFSGANAQRIVNNDYMQPRGGLRRGDQRQRSVQYRRSRLRLPDRAHLAEPGRSGQRHHGADHSRYLHHRHGWHQRYVAATSLCQRVTPKGHSRPSSRA